MLYREKGENAILSAVKPTFYADANYVTEFKRGDCFPYDYSKTRRLRERYAKKIRTYRNALARQLPEDWNLRISAQVGSIHADLACNRKSVDVPFHPDDVTNPRRFISKSLNVSSSWMAIREPTDVEKAGARILGERPPQILVILSDAQTAVNDLIDILNRESELEFEYV